MLLCMCIACAVADSDDSSVISSVRFVTAEHIAVSNHDACMYLFIDIYVYYPDGVSGLVFTRATLC